MKTQYHITLCALFLHSGTMLHAAKGYVTNNSGNSVSVFDTTTNKVTNIVNDPQATINSPNQLAITPNGTKAYVVNSNGTTDNGSVSIINVANDTVIQKVTDLSTPTFDRPQAIAITPNGAFAYVTNANNNSVSIIDISTNSVIGTVTDLFPTTLSSPLGIAITPDGATAYVVNTGNDTVSVVNLKTNKVTETVATPNFATPFYIAITPSGQFAYVTNNGNNTVSIINIANNATQGLVTDIGTFNVPFDVAITPNGLTAYVSNAGVVSVINVKTNTVTQTVTSYPHTDPQGIAFTQDSTIAYIADEGGRNPSFVGIVDVTNNTLTPQGSVTDLTPATFSDAIFIAIVPAQVPQPTPPSAKVYVTNEIGNSVSIFNTSTNVVTGTVTDLIPATFNNPTQIAVTPNGKTAYVINTTHLTLVSTISVINVATNAVTQKVTDLSPHTFQDSQDIAITPDGTTAYVTNFGNNSVSVINLTSNSVTQTVTGTFNGPTGIAINSAGTFAYVTNNTGNTVSVINLSSNTVIQTITSADFNGPQFIAIAPNGFAYVTNNTGNTVSIIDLSNNTVIGIVTDPHQFLSGPFAIAINPNGTTAYVTNQTTYRVVAINLSNNTVIGPIGDPNFNLPVGVAFTSDGSVAYVANANSDTVSIINTALNSVTLMGVVSDPDHTFNFPQFIVVIPIPASTSSIFLSGTQNKNIFLTQTDYINIITWIRPTNVTPVTYKLYRNAALTTLAGTVAATAPLQFVDHNRNPKLNYTYYLVAVDAAGTSTLLGNVTVNGKI
ncbi:MAG: beta-propeller fold lactonase family protein [Candidatus Babeliales bacterium]